MKHEIEIPEGMEFDAENSIIKFKPVTTQKTPEQMFQDMWEGCTIYRSREYPDSVFYMKNGEWWFELDTKTNDLWCRYMYVWGVLETENNWDYTTIQSFIKNQVEERFKMIGVTPTVFEIPIDSQVEERFKMIGVTPDKLRGARKL